MPGPRLRVPGLRLRVPALTQYREDLFRARNRESGRPFSRDWMDTVDGRDFSFAIADLTGRLKSVDRALAAMLGYDPQELLSLTLYDITYPEDVPGNESLLDRLRTHEEPFTIAKRYLRRDGSVLWVQNYVSILRDAAGTPSICVLIRTILPPPEVQAQAAPQRNRPERPVAGSSARQEGAHLLARLQPRLLVH
jgi:PAS domain S-box-containing protein